MITASCRCCRSRGITRFGIGSVMQLPESEQHADNCLSDYLIAMLPNSTKNKTKIKLYWRILPVK